MRSAFFLLAAVLPLLVAQPARADVPPPDTQGCTGKAAGDACKADDGTDHTCKAETCTKLDYSMGTPPTTVTYDCLLCKEAGGASSSSVGSGGSSGEGGSSASGSKTDGSDDTGCSVRPGAAAGAASAWALGLGLLVLARRAKRTKKQTRG